MTRHPIAQFTRNGNPNRKKSGPAPAISCEIDYFARRVWPGTSTVPRFFTDDFLRNHTGHIAGIDLFVVPKGVEHKPYAENEVKLLLIEPRGVLNTGNVGGERTAEQDVWI